MTDAGPTARGLAPAHRRRVMLVIVVTQLVLALATGTTVYAVWHHLDGNIQSGGEIPGGTRSAVRGSRMSGSVLSRARSSS